MSGFRENMRPMSIVVAVDNQGGFANKGKIPWNYPSDFARFKMVTAGKTCIVGRGTYIDMLRMWASREVKHNRSTLAIRKFIRSKDPSILMDEVQAILPGRKVIVLSSRYDELPGVSAVVPSLRAAVQTLPENDISEMLILGGLRLFIEAMPWCHTIYLTAIDKTYKCDQYFPMRSLSTKFKIVDGIQDQEDPLYYMTYQRVAR